jgi:uncharacterized cupredoxin-like copper-binding protein
MNRITPALAILLAASVASAAAFSAELETKVRVALLDASAVAGFAGGQPGGGGWGQGMMGYGMMGGGMMGPGGYAPNMMGRGMMSIRVDETSIKAGTVVFDVTNWSRSVVHEMVVVVVDSPDAPLPYDSSRWIVPEDQTKVLGESGELGPNASQDVTLTLPAGSYMLICNVPGHFASGMAVPFTVTP